MRGLFLLLAYSILLSANCSLNIGKAFINEVFIKSNNTSSSENWVEIRLLDNIRQLTSNWTLQINTTKGKSNILYLTQDNFQSNGNYLTSSLPINISRNTNESTNITLFDENNNTIDTLTIYGKNGDKTYYLSNQTCTQFVSTNYSVSTLMEGSAQTSFDDAERLNDGALWVSWKNSSTKNTTNISDINNMGYKNDYTLRVYNTPLKRLKTLLSSQQFYVTVETDKDLVNTNRILIVGSTDSCQSENVNLNCIQTTLENGVLSTTVSCTTPNEAYEQVWLKIFDGKKATCSLDSFAIRPAELKLYQTQNIKAGEDILIQAVDQNGFLTNNYNSSVYIAGVIKNQTCPNQSPLGETLNIKNGVGKFYIHDIGSIETTLYDANFTKIDQPHDCIVDSAQNRQNADGLIGCNIAGLNTISVLPSSLQVDSVSLSNQGNRNFTYLYGDDLENMSAKIGFKVVAVSKNGEITKNYSTGCYESGIKITPSINSSKTGFFLNPFEDFIFPKFIKGILTVDTNSDNSIKFNFTKPSKPVNPIIILPNDIKLDIVDLNGTKSSQINTENNSSVTFLYSRAVVHTLPNGNIKIFAEIYDKNITSRQQTKQQSINGGYFWINNDDNFSYFDIFINDSNKKNSNTHQFIKTSNSSGYLLHGAANIDIENSFKQSYQKAKIHINTPPWFWNGLVYDFKDGSSCSSHLCTSVEFFSSHPYPSWLGYGNKIFDKTLNSLPDGNRKKIAD